MDYITQINETLMPKPKQAPLVLDLFAGCGGLALGFEAEGFATVGFEMNADACATYRRNLHGECHQVRLAPETVIPASTVIIGGLRVSRLASLEIKKEWRTTEMAFPSLSPQFAHCNPIYGFLKMCGGYFTVANGTWSKSFPNFESWAM